MTITFFGALWLIMVAASFMTNKPKYMVALTLSAMVFQSISVLFLGEEGIGPQVITSGIMIVYTFVSAFFVKKSKQVAAISSYRSRNISMVFCALFVVVILISYKTNKADYEIEKSRFFTLLLMLLIYIVCTFSCWSMAKRLRKEDVEKIILRICAFVAIFGLMQFLVSMGIFPKGPLWTTLIYNTKSESIAFFGEGDSYIRLYSTFMEPSYCGAFLVGAFYYIINLKMSKKRIWLSIILAIDILLTFSSTAYGTFAIIGLIYLVFSKNKAALKFLIPIGIIILTFLLVSGQLSEILNSVIFEKSDSGSYKVRELMDSNSMEQFYSSPYFGVGYKNARGSKFIPSLLAQTGIAGGLTWFFIIIPLIVYGIKKSNIKNSPAIWFLLSVVVAMFIAIPDIDNTSFWMSMYICGLSFSAIKRTGNENTPTAKMYEVNGGTV